MNAMMMNDGESIAHVRHANIISQSGAIVACVLYGVLEQLEDMSF